MSSCARGFAAVSFFKRGVGPVAPLLPLSAPFLRRVLVLGYRERARRATLFVSVPVVVLASSRGRVLLSSTTRAGTWNQWRIASTGAKGLHFVARRVGSGVFLIFLTVFVYLFVRVRLFLCSFVLYRPLIPGEHRPGIWAVDCVAAHLRGFEEDSRSGVVFWIDVLSIEFGCLFFICRGTCAVECVAAHLRGSEEDSRSEVVFWIVLPFSSS